MKQMLTAFAALALAGCGGLRFENDPVPAAGSVWIAEPVVRKTHVEIDKRALSETVRLAAAQAVAAAGFGHGGDEMSADIVIRMTIEDFWLGDEAVRSLGWKVDERGEDRPSFRAKATIRAPGQPLNSAELSDTVNPGNRGKDSIVDQRRRALIEAIARMHVEIAEEYRK
ncbi:MAG: hypothetical protein FD180_1337 [Planctomycetota bacterium]|nr:MAG: hypothetical protein FD180_1337 [Planctomycetota bacterium]